MRANSIAVGDFNHDGNADLAITNQFDSTVSIFLGDGKGNFAAPNVAATLFLPLVAFRTPWLWETSTMTASKT
jgi:hypothetical protein